MPRIDITKNEIFEQWKSEVREVIEDDDVAEALRVRKALKMVLDKRESELAANPEVAAKYQELLMELQFQLFANTKDSESLALIQEHLVDALSIPELDIMEKIRRKIFYIEIEEEQISFMIKLMDALKKNMQQFGPKPLNINGKQYPATIQNWILDYDAFPTKNSKRANIDTLNYMSKSPNPGILTKDQREDLIKILEIFDSLKNRIAEYNSSPISGNIEEAFKGFNLAYLMPGVVLDESEVKKLPIDIPNDTTRVSEKVSIAIPTEVAQKRVKPIVPLVNLQPEVKPLNIQDVLRQGGGLAATPVVRPPEKKPAPVPLVDVSAQAEMAQQKEKAREEEINRKLEELKKKIGE